MQLWQLEPHLQEERHSLVSKTEPDEAAGVPQMPAEGWKRWVRGRTTVAAHFELRQLEGVGSFDLLQCQLTSEALTLHEVPDKFPAVELVKLGLESRTVVFRAFGNSRLTAHACR